MFYTISKILWLAIAPTNALVLLTTAVAIWAALRKSKFAAWLAVICLFGLVLGSFTPVGIWLMVPLENRFPQWQIGSEGAPDGIIAIGGDSGEGILALLELSRSFPQARLVLSGEGDRIFANEPILDTFTRLGGDPARLILETRSRTTFENAAFSRRLINPLPGERWLLLTSALHMPRAVGCFRRAGFHIETYPVVFKTRTVSSSFFEKATGSAALSQIDAATKEWLGLLVYWLTGKTNALFPAP